MEDKLYVLKLGKCFYAGAKLAGNNTVLTLTDKLLKACFNNDVTEVKKWQDVLGGEILQIDLKSHPIG